jgi:hypothetical protein
MGVIQPTGGGDQLLAGQVPPNLGQEVRLDARDRDNPSTAPSADRRSRQ